MTLLQEGAGETFSSEFLARGQVIREPLGAGPGYWVGAPGIFFAADERKWYLTYRIRRPRGVHPDRGGEARIACSSDLENWEDIWSVTKDGFHSASIERCALQKDPEGRWHYFVSFVDPIDGCWCVARMQAAQISRLNPAEAVPLFKAKPLGLEGVKDPWIFETNGQWKMLLSVALPSPKTNAQSHSTLDIFNTGECLSATALATSSDLVQWSWHGMIFAPSGPGWDAYCRRINSIVPVGKKYLAFYDGSASYRENYEEKTGLAISSNLLEWQTCSPDRPSLTSPHASGSLRYLDARRGANEVIVSYEFARPDGSHDLRLCRFRSETIDALCNHCCKP